MTGRNLRKGVTESGAKKVAQLSVKTKGILDHVTIMSVVSAAGVAYKTCSRVSREACSLSEG